MQSHAKTNVGWNLVLLGAIAFSNYMAFGGTLECASPPGGTITCEDRQTPICRIKDGKVEGECKTPPPKIGNRAQLQAWGLSEVLQKPVSVDELKKPENRAILQQGRYKNNKENTTFRLPEMLPNPEPQ
jgi:hypothetical protein